MFLYIFVEFGFFLDHINEDLAMEVSQNYEYPKSLVLPLGITSLLGNNQFFGMVPPFQETSIPSVSPCGCSPCVPISRNTRLCQVTKLSQTNNHILPSSPKRHLSHLDMRNHSSRERSVGFFQRENFTEHVFLHSVL